MSIVISLHDGSSLCARAKWTGPKWGRGFNTSTSTRQRNCSIRQGCPHVAGRYSSKVYVLSGRMMIIMSGLVATPFRLMNTKVC